MALSKVGKNQVDQSASLTVDGDLTVDTNTLVVDSTNNRVGIKTVAPDLALHVEGTNAAPASSGSTPTGFVSLRQKDGGSSHGANIGVLGVPPWGTWIQGQDANNLATSYPLLLNPNGGSVGIGTTSPIQKLHIEGNTQVNGYVFQNNGTNAIGLWGEGNADMRFGTNNAERMQIDSSGRVTMPYQPAFLAYLVTTTGKATSVSVVPGTFATYYNVGGHYSTSTKRFTAPVAGLYLFTGTIATEGSAGSFNYLSCEFWVNGSRTFVGGWQGNSSPSYSKSASSVVLSLSASDYVELACETNKAFNIQGGSANYTYFNGYLVG